jgi:hypothetical protein
LTSASRDRQHPAAAITHELRQGKAQPVVPRSLVKTRNMRRSVLGGAALPSRTTNARSTHVVADWVGDFAVALDDI